MEYILWGIPIIIAFLIFYFSVSSLKKNKKMVKNINIAHRQSDNHMFLKEFFNRDTTIKSRISQLEKRKEKSRLKVIFTDDGKAYWVDNNIFYVAEVIDGKPNFENAKQIDTENMSKNELDKMLFILDNLSRGDKNERGSSGN